jgi:hypothetical protein
MMLFSSLVNLALRTIIVCVILLAPISNGTRAELRERPANTIRDALMLLRSCWIPPPEDVARVGMQITVRLSLTRTGKILGRPRIAFETEAATDAQRIAYRIAVMSMLQRCTPLPITDALGKAIAGRPLSIRLIDGRQQRRTKKLEWRETTARNSLRASFRL